MARAGKERFQGAGKYKGMTRKQCKRMHKSETVGKEKSPNCRATNLEKAMIKYPRARKTFRRDYIDVQKRKDKYAHGRTSCFDNL